MSGPKAGDLFVTAARRDPARARIALRERLEERRGELEEALLARVYGVADPTGIEDPAYLEGLRAAAAAAIDFGLETIEASQDRLPLPPPVLLAQARLAARHGVGLDTILRRYSAGHAMLVDFLVEGTEGDAALSLAELRKLLAISSSAFDRLVAAVGEEHARELQSRPNPSRERRLAERVERLLAGEPIDAGSLGYDLSAEHLGAVASGPGAEPALRDLATALDRRLLLVQGGEGAIFGWLGGHRSLDRQALDPHLTRTWPDGPLLALGEPARGTAGWRLTHRQAQAAFTVAQRGAEAPARYANVALLTSVLRDDLLASSLRHIYLDPLENERDGGEALRQTLRAYFAAGRNIASAAAALGVTRQTIHNRLRVVEERINRPLGGQLAALEAALELQGLAPSAAETRVDEGRLAPTAI